MRLTLLAPDLIEAVLEGTAPAGLAPPEAGGGPPKPKPTNPPAQATVSASRAFLDCGALCCWPNQNMLGGGQKQSDTTCIPVAFATVSCNCHRALSDVPSARVREASKDSRAGDRTRLAA
jgi:hypothetical protein